MVVVLGLWLNLAHKRLVTGVWMFVSMLALSTAIVYTGTRTGFLTSMIGLSVYLVPYWKHRWRMSTVIVGVIAIAGLAYIAANTPVFSERWHEFSEEGDTSGRDTIFAEALDMISERPLLGWQPVEFEYELGCRTGNTKSGIKAAHNIFLHLFMEVGHGWCGAIPDWTLVVWTGSVEGPQSEPGPLASGAFGSHHSLQAWVVTSIYTKTLWFVLAVTVAARGERKRQGMILVGRPIENGIQTSSWKLNSSTPGEGVWST